MSRSVLALEIRISAIAKYPVIFGLLVLFFTNLVDAHAQAIDEFPVERKAVLMARLTRIEDKLDTNEIPIIPGDPGVILLSERLTIVDKTGKRLILRQLAYKSLTEAGAKANADEVVSFRKKSQKIYLLSAETIQADGSRQAVKPNALLLQTPQREADYSLYDDETELKVIFPNVKPGSVTHLIYAIEDEEVKIPGEFAQTLTWESSWPIGLTRLQIELPDSFAERLNIAMLGNDVPSPVITRVEEGRKLFTWEVVSRAGRTYELDRAPSDQIGPTAHVTTIKSWDTVAQWFQGLLKDRDSVGPDLQRAVDSWTAGLNQPVDIASKLHREIADSVRYVGLEFGEADYQPHSCNEVWENQYGDCKDKANLLVAVLRSQGIPAYITLVNTRHLGLIDRRAPDYRTFDHAIVAIAKPTGGYTFCDPTIDHSLPGMLGSGTTNREVLIIKDGKAEWAKTPSSEAGHLTYNFDLKLAEDGELSGWLNYTSYGYYSATERTRLGALDNQSFRSEMSTILRGFFAGAEVIDAGRSETEPSTSYPVKAYFISAKKGRTSPDKYTLVFPSSTTLLNNVGDKAERETNFATAIDSTEASAKISLPPGLRPLKIPLPFEKDSPTFSCRASWVFVGDTCRTEVRIETKQSSLRPQEFALYYEAIESLKSWLSEPVLLVKDTPTNAGLTGEIAPDLPTLINGSAQIDLIDRRYPAEGEQKIRRRELEKAVRAFSSDQETLFRARARLGMIDWDEGKLSDAHIQLHALITNSKGKIKKDLYTWVELNDALVLKALNKKTEAIATLQRLAHDPNIASDYRNKAVVNIADFMLSSATSNILDLLKETVVRPNGATPEIESRLAHAFLLNNQENQLKDHLTSLMGIHPDSYDDIYTALLVDASTWNIKGDERNRKTLANLIEEITPELSTALQKAVTFCKSEAEWNDLHEQLIERLNTTPDANWPKIGEQDASPPLLKSTDPSLIADQLDEHSRSRAINSSQGKVNSYDTDSLHPELISTLQMIATHTTLRSRKITDPDSAINREVLRQMIQKSFRTQTAPSCADISWPSANAVVGTLHGEFSVDDRGAANYTLSLNIPESRVKLTPNLQLNYYSLQGSGLLGEGFSFSTGFYRSIVRGR